VDDVMFTHMARSYKPRAYVHSHHGAAPGVKCDAYDCIVLVRDGHGLS